VNERIDRAISSFGNTLISDLDLIYCYMSCSQASQVLGIGSKERGQTPQALVFDRFSGNYEYLIFTVDRKLLVIWNSRSVRATPILKVRFPP